MQWWAWGTTGMACYVCHVAIIPNTFHENISEAYVRALVESDISGLTKIEVVPTPWYEEHCCLPAEEPKNVEAHTE